METHIIIPARYGSVRFPGKPLAKLKGRPLIEWVYDACNKAEGITSIRVATDDERIVSVLHAKKIPFTVTTECSSGTERCAEAMSIEKLSGNIINVQGDEPLIDIRSISILTDLLSNGAHIASLYRTVNYEEANNVNRVKVVTDVRENAMYFSRSLIPHAGKKDHPYKIHIGVYGFKSQVLGEVAKLNEDELEQRERLEQLRWLRYGYPISMAETDHMGIGVDTPEDLKRVESLLDQ